MKKKVCEDVLEPRRGADAAIRLHMGAEIGNRKARGKDSLLGGRGLFGGRIFWQGGAHNINQTAVAPARRCRETMAADGETMAADGSLEGANALNFHDGSREPLSPMLT